MKRSPFIFILVAFMCVVFALALTACGGPSGETGENPEKDPPYDPDTVIVTYDANGGRFSDGENIYSHKSWKNSMLVQPKAPSRENYDFIGWVKNKGGEDFWTFESDKIVENVTLYAAWEAKTFTVDVSPDYVQAGTVEGGGDYVFGDKVTVTAVDKKNIGYTFAGWFNGEELLTKELSYTFDMPAENVAYIAKWSVDEALSDFNFHSTATTCIIDGLKDKTITEITVPDYVTAIGNYAFMYCESLISASLGEGVSSVGERAFSDCSALQSLTLGKSVNNFAFRAFYNCDKLSEVRFNGDIAGWCNIENLSALTYEASSNRKLYIDGSEITGELTIPDGVTAIPEGAFYYCRGLTKVTVPDSVTTVGFKSFCGCGNLSELTIPFVGRSNGDREFAHMGYMFGASYNYLTHQYAPRYLRKVTITGNTSIKSGAFIGCRELTCIVLGDGVTSVDRGVFSDCQKLTSVVLGGGLTFVDEAAFAYCKYITSVFYKGSAESWANVEIKAVDNEYLTGAPLYFYSEMQPATEGSFWHYGADGETPEIW